MGVEGALSRTDQRFAGHEAPYAYTSTDYFPRSDVHSLRSLNAWFQAVRAAASLPQRNMLGGPPRNFGSTMCAFPTVLKTFTTRAPGNQRWTCSPPESVCPSRQSPLLRCISATCRRASAGGARRPLSTSYREGMVAALSGGNGAVAQLPVEAR
jgi:hypothetical protein